MTTTSKFQIKKDFYLSKDDCIASERKPINTNPRYKFFTQTHFTAGDIDQFQDFRNMTNGKVKNVNITNNVFSTLTLNIWEKYKDLTPTSVDDTFNYMFHKFKKGVFLKIKNGKLSVFLPFSKKNFTNEWSKLIQVDPKYGNIQEFIKHIQLKEGRKFYPQSVNKFTDCWYSNNCLVRWEFPIAEGDTGVPMASDMFLTLAQEREIPDLEFFLNRRDFPMLKRNNTEPYEHLFGHDKKLLSHLYTKYSPILSMVTSDEFADIPIPTAEDWARVSRKDGKFFPKTSTRDYTVTPTPWKDRKPIAVFRGASTGCGVTPETNPRLKLALLSKTTHPDTDGLPLLDAGITDWNLRPRKIIGQPYLQTIDIEKLPFGLVDKLTPQQQTSYKYVVNVDGHVSAHRLSLEMESGFCILLVQSKYKLWFRDMLKPFVHYVPVKSDLSDLIEKIRWCKENDSKCKKIAQNSCEFSKKYLTKDGILDYLQKVLYELKKATGVYLYNSISLRELQEEKEKELLSKLKTHTPTKQIVLFPEQTRSYNFLKGIEMCIDEKYTEKKEIFSSKSTTVSKYEIGGRYFVEKKSDKNMTHEAFVTLYGTNKLLQYVPNFAYTFSYKKDLLVSEYIEGMTLTEYIHSDEFKMKDYLLIIVQIALAIGIAQEKCGFIHYDLSPWNIIVKKEKTIVDYVLDKKVYRVSTDLVPVIIDMERAHVIYEDYHYGSSISLFGRNTVQDILTLLSMSIYEICREDVSKEQVKDLLTLANFLTGTGYHKKPFLESGRDGLGELRYFFNKAKKYSELISSNKYDLVEKVPSDLVVYMMEKFKLTVNLVETPSYNLNSGFPEQVAYFATAKTSRQRALSYIVAFQKIINTDDYYDVEMVKRFGEEMIKYLHKENIEDKEKFVRKYKKTLKLVKNRHPKIEEETAKNTVIDYNEETFLFPEKILKLLETKTDSGPDWNTLKFLANKVYKKNLEELEECKETEKYRDLYKRIIT